MPMIDQRIKCHPESFASIKSGDKPFTVRLNDRGYQQDHLLLIEEYDPAEKAYTGAAVLARVKWMHSGLGMKPGYVALGLCGVSPAGERYAPKKAMDSEPKT